MMMTGKERLHVFQKLKQMPYHKYYAIPKIKLCAEKIEKDFSCVYLTSPKK